MMRSRSPIRRPRLGLLVSWFVGFWVAGVRPSLAAVLAAWTVYAALSERPQIGLEWAVFGAILTVLFGVLAVQPHI